MIIDSHAHVMLPIEKQLLLMEDAGINKTILFSTTPHPERANNLESFEKEMAVLNNILAGNCTIEERVNSIKETTIELCEKIKKYPDKFLGFGAVPLSLSYEETCQWIDKNIVSNRLLGVGELTIGTGQAKLLNNIFRALTDFKGLPIWIHTFHPLNLSDIKYIVELSKEFVKIPVIFGHMGGINWLDTIKIAKEHRNIYLDLSATFTAIAPKLAMSELPERTLFSSDAPYGDPLLARKMVELLSPSDEITDMVLGENITKLLNIN